MRTHRGEIRLGQWPHVGTRRYDRNLEGEHPDGPKEEREKRQKVLFVYSEVRIGVKNPKEKLSIGLAHITLRTEEKDIKAKVDFGVLAGTAATNSI